jgi:hypothetical protein
MQNKTLKVDSSGRQQPQHQADDVKWIKNVIEQEHTKPLEVNQQYVLDYEKKEKENTDRLNIQVDRHLSTLSNLRNKLEQRVQMKATSDEYRSWKKGFSEKKNAIMIGKTIAELNGNDENYDNNKRSQSKTLTKGGGGSSELSTVLDSLNRLATLEKRISSLEKENEYDEVVGKDKPPAYQRTSIEFRKKRTPLEGGESMGINYALRPKKTSWNVKIPAGQGVSGAGTRAKIGNKSGGGAFLTDFGDDGDEPEMSAAEKRELQKRERQKQLAMATQGQKNVRNRVLTKKAQEKEKVKGASKHEAALKELNRRRHEQQITRQRVPGRNAQPSKGAAAGIKNKNKHLQDFQNIKNGHNKRKDDLKKKLNRKGGTDATSFTAPAKIGGGLGGNRAGGGRQPRIVKTGGTVTRRTDQPTRRGQQHLTAPNNPAVGGIGGVKILRDQNNLRGGKSAPAVRGGRSGRTGR